MGRRPARSTVSNRATGITPQPKGVQMKSHMDPWTMQVAAAQKVASVGLPVRSDSVAETPIETKVVAAPKKRDVTKTVIDADVDPEHVDTVPAD